MYSVAVMHELSVRKLMYDMGFSFKEKEGKE